MTSSAFSGSFYLRISFEVSLDCPKILTRGILDFFTSLLSTFILAARGVSRNAIRRAVTCRFLCQNSHQTGSGKSTGMRLKRPSEWNPCMFCVENYMNQRSSNSSNRSPNDIPIGGFESWEARPRNAASLRMPALQPASSAKFERFVQNAKHPCEIA
jgi:hypothetical protein